MRKKIAFAHITKRRTKEFKIPSNLEGSPVQITYCLLLLLSISIYSNVEENALWPFTISICSAMCIQCARVDSPILSVGSTKGMRCKWENIDNLVIVFMHNQLFILLRVQMSPNPACSLSTVHWVRTLRCEDNGACWFNYQLTMSLYTIIKPCTVELIVFSYSK